MNTVMDVNKMWTESQRGRNYEQNVKRQRKCERMDGELWTRSQRQKNCEHKVKLAKEGQTQR